MVLCVCCKNDAEEANNTPGAFTDGQTLGEGATKFTFTVMDPEGKETTAEIQTDKTTVGEALLELGLIAAGPWVR